MQNLDGVRVPRTQIDELQSAPCFCRQKLRSQTLEALFTPFGQSHAELLLKLNLSTTDFGSFEKLNQRKTNENGFQIIVFEPLGLEF